MAATIYAAPEEIKVPKIVFSENFSLKEHQKKEDKYIEELKAYIQENGDGSEQCGEIIQFPMGDGHAMYMVAGMKPLELIHIPLGDAWDSPDVDLMTPARVKQKIESQKKLDKLFKKKE